LRAVDLIKKGALIATMSGELVEGDEPPLGAGREVFHVRSPTTLRPGAWLLLSPPSSDELANLVNTGAGARANNAELTLNRRALVVNLRATRTIQPGQDILAAYGADYTRLLQRRPAQPAKPLFGLHTCERCGARVKSLKKHEAAFGPCRKTAVQ
jgi:hypothetical protein